MRMSDWSSDVCSSDLAASIDGLAVIMGKPPPCIKRHAEYAYRPAPQQGLEAHLRRYDIDGPRMLQQASRMNIVIQQAHARMHAQLLQVEVSLLASRHHVWMHFQQNSAVWIFFQRGGQHTLEAVSGGAATMNGRIAPGLIYDQYIIGRKILADVARVVVFRYAAFAPCRSQVPGTLTLWGIQGSSNQ